MKIVFLFCRVFFYFSRHRTAEWSSRWTEVTLGCCCCCCCCYFVFFRAILAAASESVCVVGCIFARACSVGGASDAIDGHWKWRSMRVDGRRRRWLRRPWAPLLLNDGSSDGSSDGPSVDDVLILLLQLFLLLLLLLLLLLVVVFLLRRRLLVFELLVRRRRRSLLLRQAADAPRFARRVAMLLGRSRLDLTFPISFFIRTNTTLLIPLFLFGPVLSVCRYFAVPIIHPVTFFFHPVWNIMN